MLGQSRQRERNFPVAVQHVLVLAIPAPAPSPPSFRRCGPEPAMGASLTHVFQP